MEKNTGKVREFCKSGKVGTMLYIVTKLNTVIFDSNISILPHVSGVTIRVFMVIVKENWRPTFNPVV